MAFTADEKFAPLEQKVWLCHPPHHAWGGAYIHDRSIRHQLDEHRG